MNIGIIGAGNLGTGLAKQLVRKQHSVMLSFARDLTKLHTAAQSLGVKASTAEEAVSFGDVVALATPWSVTTEILQQIGAVEGPKILWDCTNALKPDMSGLAIGTTTSGGEEVAKLAQWAKVVKAIPPFAEVLHSANTMVGGGPTGVFVCGDDAEAREIVAALVEDIGGAPIVAGPLQMARYIEPACMLLVQLAYRQGLGARIGLQLQIEKPERVPRGAPR
jgi:8-hydroxy-5-deazaflavin:NADPH oxidoreductase